MPAWLSIGLALLLAAPAHAEDGMAMLQRMVQAAQQLTYSGVFVYRSGSKVETSRIAHAAVGGREVEHIEALDGSPREVLREGDEVKCFLPEEKLLIVESASRRQSFPSLLPAGLGSLPDNYTVRIGGSMRVAGLTARLLQLEPRDKLRYGHEFWVDSASGLLLKAGMLNERGETLESFAFSQVRIGGALDEQALRPGFGAERLRVQQVRAVDVRPEEIGWSVRNAPAGFRRVAAMRRQPDATTAESLHMVFSDGLASISLFIEAGAASGEKDSASRMGLVNVYRRQVGDYRIMAMGEVPPQTVRMLADALERRRK